MLNLVGWTIVVINVAVGNFIVAAVLAATMLLCP